MEYPGDFVERQQPIPLPNSFDAGAVDIQKLTLGLSISWAKCGFGPERGDRLFPLAEINAQISEPALIIQSVHSGNIVMIDRCSGAEMSIASGTALFEHVDNVDFTLLVSGSAVVEMATLIIGKSALSSILGEEPAQTLLEAAKIAKSPSTRLLSIPRRISSVLQSGLPNGLDEDLRKLFAHARALEYLCLLVAHITGEAAFPGHSRREEQIRSLYDELLALDGKLPPLLELAERYGMSAKTLNDNFKQMFGQTIGAFMAELRLNRAHAAMEETDIPMKILAARTGYSHVNNFINAFRNKFGYPPGALRR